MKQEERVALVTGGAGGIGRAVAERLAKNGISLVLADLNGQAAAAAASEVSSLGGPSVSYQLDVSDESSVANLYEQIERRFGRLDILVNNAGISGLRIPVEKMPLSTWEETLRVNLTGTFLMCRGGIPLMKKHKWGRIINISSHAARSRTGTGKAQYAAAKTGMNGFARVLAEEVGLDGITVNSVCPSRTMTPLTEATAAAAGNTEYFQQGAALTVLGRLAQPLDTAAAVAFFCSEEAGFITGAIIDVNGGAFMP
jgi:NAD(P)-dependent dehydrogenase (short-subunit alcohol dehydrogenase family)